MTGMERSVPVPPKPGYRRIRAALFDLDGTLIDSVTFLRGAFRDFLDSAGIAGPVDPREYDGLPIRQIAAKLLPDKGRPEESAKIADEYLAIIQHAYEHILQPVAGAQEVLTTLRGRGLRLGLVTSAVDKMVCPLLARIGWGEVFDVVVSGDRVGRTKPAPDCYVAALTSLGLAADDAIAVEDSANGILAARGAGLTVIGVSPADHAASLRLAGAVQTVAAIGDVAALVLQQETAGD